MAIIKELEGLQEVLTNLRRANRALEDGAERGLKKAGLFLQRESQKLVPVDFGNLKASAFTRAEGKGFDTAVSVGYTAGYALYVHEAVGMVLKGQARSAPSKGRYWDPQGRAQAKFLEEPARRLAPDLTRIVQENIQS
jgi:hypothetical protein